MENNSEATLAVPYGMSGRFIGLAQEGKLGDVSDLWALLERANEQLASAETKLALCNNPAWLFAFNAKCQRNRQDFGEELRKLVDVLERKRAVTKSKVEAARTALRSAEPLLAEHTLAGYGSGYGARFSYRAARTGHGDLVAARNAVIQANSSKSSLDICRRLDFASLQIPDGWSDDFPELKTWVDAYQHKKCQNRVHKLISEAKHQMSTYAGTDPSLNLSP